MKFITSQLHDTLKRKGYAFFDKGVFNLNIIGVRSRSSESNKFDDWLYVIYRDQSFQWVMKEFTITTDPGKPWLLTPIAGTGGTAILVPGQYRGAYMIGIHGRSHKDGGYEALEQRKPMRYVRDNNRDAIVDTSLYRNNSAIFEANLKTNIHRASKYSIVRFVETYSAGCQVFQDPKQFEEFMYLCRQQRAIHNANTFTYTLLEECDIK